jgi:hypothetical protein
MNDECWVKGGLMMASRSSGNEGLWLFACDIKGNIVQSIRKYTSIVN